MQVKRTTAEWKQIQDGWQQSGLSQRAFCKNANINISSFNKWLKRIKLRDATINNCTNKLKFLHISNAIQERNQNHEKSFLEITLPSGINFKMGLSQDSMNIFLQELLKWK